MKSKEAIGFTSGTPRHGLLQLRCSSVAVCLLFAGVGIAHAQSNAASATTATPATNQPAQQTTGQAQGDQQLKPITISAEREKETATSPVNGYVAKRSASGSKTDTPIVEVPQSISVITADQMQAQAVQSVGQALLYTPGVMGQARGGLDTTVDYFVVRGFPNQFPFIDGLSTQVFFTLIAPAADPYGLERVDILRGPASVLYGQNVPGGMVNLVTKRPTDEPLHEVSFAVGSYGSVGGRFDLSGPVNKDGTLLYRLTGDATINGSQTDFQTDKRFYIAPALTWKPSADTTFTLLTHFGYRNSSIPSGDLPAVGTLLPGPNGAKIGTNVFDGEPNFNQNRRTEESLGYEFEHRFNDWLTVRQNLRYTHVDLVRDVVGNLGLQPDLATINRYAYDAKASADVFAVDNQAQFKFNTGVLQHTALVGVDYVHSIDRWAENDATSVPSLNLYNPVYGGPITLGGVDYSVTQTIDQVGLYAQDQIRFGKLVATLGVREDWASTSEFNRISGQTDQDNDATRFTYRAGLVYLFDSGFAPYVSYATSFQPGLGSTFSGSALKPTTGQSIEAGIKYQPPGQKSFAMLSAFNILQKNVVEPDTNHLQGNYVLQTGAIRVKGVELSGVADLGAGLNLTAAYTYMDGVVTESDVGLVGNAAPNVPHNSISFWLDKTFQQGWWKGFGLGGGVRYLGPQYGDAQNDVRMPGVTLFDAAIHYDIDHWRFSVNAQNLFDRIYVNCVGINFCAYGTRRNVIGRATYQW
ncbi:TonB-dependent siderophore receptor [Paraburkholderia acidicola]|uniref:TonB-dependent siderophore receptor n=1 Tax=Paraburkholderia acidicola TaxID=1912599 RepID=A0ABV1LHN9_9BURK